MSITQMDVPFGTDVQMDDEGDVVDSTEIPDFTLKPELEEPPKSTPVPQLHPSSFLKGNGIRRELDTASSLIVVRRDAPRPAKFSSLPRATLQTGLVYDVRMRFHVECEPSENDMHPEDPRRIHVIFEAFVNAGLAWREGASGPANDFYMGRIDARLVTEEEVRLVHTKAHWDWVHTLAHMNTDQLQDEKQHPPHVNDSIYLSSSTPYCAALSAGGAIEACRAVIMGKVKNVFAVIRPPGHHAEREDAKGFCFYDNVSIATKVCQREFRQQCRKVFILDWDVHHGNGIQQANYDDPNVLYISLHVHKRGGFYPEHSYRDNRVAYGDHLHCGEGAGKGTNVNIPWSKQGMGDADYIYAFQQVVMPIATEFDPDLVIIAAGFDAAEGDMLGGCNVTPAGYAHMTHMLMSLADGKVAVCLEGGYNLDSIARSACAVGRTLMGEPPDRLENTTPTSSGVDDVRLVLRQQSRFWTSLYPKDLSARLAGPLHGLRMQNVVRDWQAETLFNEYDMTPIFVHHDSLAKEFENQVLATRNYKERRPLLVILHDPPELLASPDPRTGRIELHNTWLTYIDWAVSHGFAVIDVNLPKHVTDYDSNDQEHKETDSVDFRTKEAQRVLTYLWDNYVELHEPTHIILMGTNTGHGAIINFIRSHEDQAQNLINKAISFVEDVSLVSCKSSTNDNLPRWYYENSLVFVSQQHNFNRPEYTRKPKRRFGDVKISPQSSISDMLIAHRDDVFAALREETADWEEEDTGRPASEDADEDEETTTAAAAKSGMMTPARLPPVQNFSFSPNKGLPVGHALANAAAAAVQAGEGSPARPPGAPFAASPKS